MNNTTNEKTREWKEREVGVLWAEEGREKTHYSGYLVSSNGFKTKVVMFRNDKMSSDNSPVFKIFKHKPREQADNSLPVAKANDNPSLPVAEANDNPSLPVAEANDNPSLPVAEVGEEEAPNL